MARAAESTADRREPARTQGSAAFGFADMTAEETALFRDLFTEAIAPWGLDGASVFDRLRAGETLGQALALPASLNELLYARAHSLFLAGRYDRAEALFRALCILDGRSADFWIGLGVCLRLRESFDDADLAFAAAAAIRPDWAVPHFHAAELAIRRESWGIAEQHVAAFDARPANDLPPSIGVEMARIRAAIALRREHAVETPARAARP